MFDSEDIEESWEATGQTTNCLIHGPPGHGKTFLAASFSEFCPEQLPATERILLKDIFWMVFDKDALDGLKGENLSAPNIDARRLMQKYEVPLIGPDGALERMIIAAHKAVQGGVKAVVVDTLTSLDSLSMRHHSDPRRAPKSRGGDVDMRAVYGLNLGTHRVFWGHMSMLPVPVLFLCHTKSRAEADDPKTVLKLRAQALPGMSELVPALTGGAPTVYQPQVSLQLAIFTTNGPGGKQKRKVFTMPNANFDAKSRFQSTLDPEEEPNLRKLYNKIRNN